MHILIGVPGILALAGILVNATIVSHLSTALNGRMAGMEARFSSVDSRINSLETRMLSLENTFTTRFDLLMERLIELAKEIHNKG